MITLKPSRSDSTIRKMILSAPLDAGEGVIGASASCGGGSADIAAKCSHNQAAGTGSRLVHRLISFHPPHSSNAHGTTKNNPITINRKLQSNPAALVARPLRIVAQIPLSAPTI